MGVNGFPTQTNDSNFPRRRVVWDQVDARDEQQGIIRVKLGELCVGPVILAHTGAVHQRDVSILPFCVPQLKKRFRNSKLNKGERKCLILGIK